MFLDGSSITLECVRKAGALCLLHSMVLCSGGPLAAQSDAISINFVGGRHSGGPNASSLAPDDVAGVIPLANWNNVARWSDTLNVSNGDPRADGMATDLVNRDGVLVPGFSLSWEADNTWAGSNPSIDNADERMMDGYIDLSGTDRDLHIDVTGIPYDRYDAYIYLGANPSNHIGVVTANDDPDTARYFKAASGRGAFTGPADYVQATALTQAEVFPSHYVFYQSLEGADLSIELMGLSNNTGVHGMQLVESFDISLSINRLTGEATLANESNFEIDFDQYEIRSSSGSIDPGAFNSLQDQDFEGNGDPGSGNGWEELGPQTNFYIGEAFLAGSSILSPGQSVSIGEIFMTGGTEDLVLSYHNAQTGVTRNGIIAFADLDFDCDFDGSGACDVQDVDNLVASIVDVKAGNAPDLTYDINGDGTVDNDDLDAWLVSAGAENDTVTGGNPFLLADANLDGVVDGQDFISWNAFKFTADSHWSGGDWNADGVTDGQDFIIWNARKFTSSGQAVPESAPCVYLILVGGLLLRSKCRPYQFITVKES